MEEYPFLLGGVPRTGSELQEIKFPFNGECIARVWHATEDDLDAAAECAIEGFSITKELSSYQRSRILFRMADELERRKAEFSRILILEAGKTVAGAQGEVERAVETLRISAEEAKRIYGELLPLDWTPDSTGRIGVTMRVPVGPVLGIIPFNFPLNSACHKLGPAIAAGNPVILKPASATPVSSIMLGEIAVESGLPAGAISVLPCPGERAERLVKDERVAFISFTGSAEVGWHLKSLSGRKRITLELGGTGAVIVEPDADLPYAVKRIVTGGYSNAGQVCISVQRVFLHKSIYDRALGMMTDAVRHLRTGDPRDPAVDIGPMISAAAAAEAYDKVREATARGAVLLAGGPPQGTLFPPALLAGTTPEMRVNKEEAFAPFITVTPYEEFSDALRLANDTDYGLQMGVFTRDMNAILMAFRDAEVGGLQVNDIPTFRVDQMPYGGVKASGTGREGPRYAIEEMTEGIFCAPMQGGTVYVDITLTPDLEAEGYAREVIRRLQEMRRQYDLKVEDFIIVDAEVADDRICTLLKEKWQDGIAEEVRARELTLRTPSEKRQKEEPFGLGKEWDVEGIRMTLSLSKAPDQQ